MAKRGRRRAREQELRKKPQESLAAWRKRTGLKKGMSVPAKERGI